MTSMADESASPAGIDRGSHRVAEIVTRLRTTFATGRTKPLDWRLRQLEGIARLVSERESDIAAALATDLGRNAHDSWVGDIASTKAEAVYATQHLKTWRRPKRVGVPPSLIQAKPPSRHEPLGVVLIIGPWNYPFYLCLGPMIGALAAGNCVVVKPSEHAAASSATMAELIPHYLDREAVAVVEGEAQVTQQLIEARMDHIFFTGGTEIGRKIMEAAAPHLTPVTLELGGKSPAVVTKDADLDGAARRIVWGKIINSGQTCLAPDYVLVEDSVKDELVSMLRSSLSEMRAGESPLQQIVNERQFRRLKTLLDERTGHVVAGGNTASTSIQPTIVVDADPDSELMKGEIFGPILPVLGGRSLRAA